MIVDKGLIDFLNQKDAEKKLASNSFFANVNKPSPYRTTTKANTPTSTTEDSSFVPETGLSGSLFSGYTPISADKFTTTPTKSTLPTLSGSLFTGYNSVSKPIIPDKPAKKEPTWLDNLDTAIGGAIAESAVNTVRTLASFFERSKATQMGGVGSDFSEQAIKRGQQLMSGDIGQIFSAIGDTLKQSNPLSIIVPAITTAASASAMKKTTATTKLLKPVEKAIHAWSNVDNADAFTQTVAGGFGSIIPSLQALIPGGMALMFVESYENTWEQEYAKQLGGNGVSDDNIMMYSLGSATLNTAFEYMGQAALGLKGWAGKLFGKGTTNILAKSTVGQGINKIMQTTAGRLVAGSAEEGLEEVFTGITTGLLASVTVNPQKWDNIWSWEDNGVSNISAASLLKQFATGAIGGGVMGGARLTGKAISDTKQSKATELFTNLNAKIDSLSDQSEITQDDYFEIQQSAQEDMSNPEAQAYVTKAAALASSKIIELNNNGVNPFAKSDSPLFDGYASPDAVSSAVGVSGTSSSANVVQDGVNTTQVLAGAQSEFPIYEDNYLKPLNVYSKVLYRETDVNGVMQIIGRHVVGDNSRELYASNDIALALGQGDNAGIIINFIPNNNIQGNINTKKQGWKFQYEQNKAEFIIRHTKRADLMDSIYSITIKKGLKVTAKEKIQLKYSLEGWIKTLNEDGSSTYFKPSKAPTRTAPIEGAKQTVQHISKAVDQISIAKKGAKLPSIDNYTVVYEAGNKHEAQISIGSKRIYVGDKFYKATASQRKKIILHEYSHSMLNDYYQQNNTNAMSLIEKGVFGTYNEKTGKFHGVFGGSDVEETLAHFATSLLSSETLPSDYYEHKEAYDYVDGWLKEVASKRKIVKKAVSKTNVEDLTKDNLLKNIANGKDVSADITAWTQTEEGQEYTKNIKTDDDVISSLEDARMDILSYSKPEMKMEYLAEFQLKVQASLNFYEKFSGENAPVKGEEGVKRFLVRFVELMERGKSNDLVKLIDSKFKIEDIIYEVTHEQDVLDTAERIGKKWGFQEYEKRLKDLQSNKLLWKPEDVVLMTEYARKLRDRATDTSKNLDVMYTSDANDDIRKAVSVGKFVAKRLHEMGVNIRMAYLVGTDSAERKAKTLEHTYLNIIKDKIHDTQYEPIVDEESRLSFSELAQARFKAITSAVSDIYKQAQALGEKMTQDEMNELISRKKTASDILANRIGKHAKNKDMPKLEKSAEQKMLQWLMTKYIETNPKIAKTEEQQQLSETAIFRNVAEMVLNRSKYASVWDNAKKMVSFWVQQAKTEYLVSVDNKVESKYDFKKIEEDLSAYLDTLANPVASRNHLERLVQANLRSMGETLNSISKKYFLHGDESVRGFVDKLKENMPNMPEDATAYLNEYVDNYFRSEMNRQWELDKSRFLERFNKRKTSKKTMVTQDYIVEKLKNALYYDEFNIDDLREVWRTKLGVSQITPEMKEMIQSAMKAYSLESDKNKQNDIYDTLSRNLAKSIPSSKLEKFVAWRRFAMLMNPPSWLKNAVSNASSLPQYAIMDRFERLFNKLGKVDEAHRTSGETLITSGTIKNYQFIKEAIDNAETADSLNRLMFETAKYAFGKNVSKYKKLFKTDWLNKMMDIPYEAMSTGKIGKREIPWLGDSPYFKRHFNVAMANKLSALNFNENMKTEERTDTLEKAVKYAAEVATTRTFRSITLFAELMKKLRSSVSSNQKIDELMNADPPRVAEAKAVRIAQKSVTVVLDVMQPFLITPFALATESYRFSPFSGLASLTKMIYHKAKGNLDSDAKAYYNHRLAQSATGTITQTMLGVLLASLGFLTGAPPDDKKEKELWVMQGKKAYSLYIPGLGSVTIDWLQPFSSGLLLGSSLFTAVDRIGKGEAFIGELASTSIDTLLMNTAVDNLRTQFGSGNVSDAILDLGINSINQSIPAIIRRFNRVIDPYERDSYSPDALQSMLNRWTGSIPVIGTMQLPVQVDIWGNEVKQIPEKEPSSFGLAGRMFLNLMTPFTVKPENMDSTSKEVLRIFESTKADGNDALPPIIGKTISKTVAGKEQTWELTPEEYVAYQKEVGQLSYAAANKVISGNGTDKQKASRLSDGYSAAVDKAKANYIKAHPIA